MFTEYDYQTAYSQPKPKASPEIAKLAKIVITWKNHDQVFYPEDILNFMVEGNLISEDEVKDIIKENPLDIRLPTKYDYSME